MLTPQWRQIDFKTGIVRLDPGTTKNFDGRTFVMTPDLRATLEPQCAVTADLQKQTESVEAAGRIDKRTQPWETAPGRRGEAGSTRLSSVCDEETTATVSRRAVVQWAAALAILQVGCNAARETLRKSPEGEWVVAEFDRTVKRLRPESERAIAEFERYAKMADQLRKNHESAPLDDKAVRDVLRRLGLGTAPSTHPGAPSPTPGAPSPAPSQRFPVPVYSDGYRWPLEAGIVSSEFGQMRMGTPHHGIDIAAEMGIPVYAAGAGEVIYAGDKLSGYGNVVILRHDQKTTTLYGHNRELKVRTGQEVKTDQVIALLGSTGRSTGPHVHFEIRQNEAPANPRSYLPKSRF